MKKAASGTTFCFLVLIFSLVAPPATAQPDPLKHLDAYVEQVRETFEVPGIGLAVVKDGQVVAAKGYGVRTLGEPEQVNAQTLFGIASNTKAFTATALGMLVEEGKLEWEAPVVRYLPWFQLSDPYITRELTVRDLLVHRSGLSLGAGDLLWWPTSTFDARDIVRRLRYVPLSTSFRSTYAYDNVLYVAAGQLIEAVSGQTWDEFVKTRILEPLGMDGAVVHPPDFETVENIASPHARIEGKVRPVAPFTGVNANPAAGIHAGAADMARWLIAQLDSGRVDSDTRIFSPALTRQLWSLVTPIPTGNPPPELAARRTDFRGYALGFEVRAYRGRKLVTHTGGLPGYLSKVAMLPDLKLGIAILTNQESGAAFESLAYHLLDAYLGVSDTDWISAYAAVGARSDSLLRVREQEIAAARDSTSRPSLPLERYAGVYTDPWYGEVAITFDGGSLEMKFAHTPWLTGTLEHWQYDTFVARWRDPEVRADAFVTFALNPDGSIDQAKMQPVSPATDFSFDFQDLVLEPVPEGEP